MLPIRDHNPSEKRPWVTYALIAVNVLVFISYWPLFANPPVLAGFFYDWAFTPARVSAGEGYHGIVTSMFLHGGLMHIAGNMLFLWIFGDNLEELFGHLGFLLFYLAAGIGAGLAQYMAEPLSRVPMVGASGAIAGVMGGYLLMFPKARVDMLVFLGFFVTVVALPAWIMLGLWFGLQIVSGAMADTAAGGVAYWAHAGGFLIGVVLTLPAWLRRGAAGWWRRTEGHPPHPEARYRKVRSSVPKVKRRKR